MIWWPNFQVFKNWRNFKWFQLISNRRYERRRKSWSLIPQVCISRFLSRFSLFHEPACLSVAGLFELLAVCIVWWKCVAGVFTLCIQWSASFAAFSWCAIVAAADHPFSQYRAKRRSFQVSYTSRNDWKIGCAVCHEPKSAVFYSFCSWTRLNHASATKLSLVLLWDIVSHVGDAGWMDPPAHVGDGVGEYNSI